METPAFLIPGNTQVVSQRFFQVLHGYYFLKIHNPIVSLPCPALIPLTLTK